VPVVFSVAAGFGVSSLSVERACYNEDAEDDYDEGPKNGREVFDVSGFLEKQAEAD